MEDMAKSGADTSRMHHDLVLNINEILQYKNSLANFNIYLILILLLRLKKTQTQNNSSFLSTPHVGKVVTWCFFNRPKSLSRSHEAFLLGAYKTN